jgi:hypothetical protein
LRVPVDGFELLDQRDERAMHLAGFDGEIVGGLVKLATCHERSRSSTLRGDRGSRDRTRDATPPLGSLQ